MIALRPVVCYVVKHHDRGRVGPDRMQAIEFRFAPPVQTWYNCIMTIEFGNGPTLRDACPWLRDDAARHRRILDVTERNSVIEGLPPFQEETRRRLMARLQGLAPPQPSPVE